MPAQVSDPFTRRLLETTRRAQAEDGSLNVAPQETFDAIGARAEAQRLETLRNIEQRAIQRGSLRSGQTSDEETERILRIDLEQTAQELEAERAERERLDAIVARQAEIEQTGVQERRGIAATGVEQRLGIETQGAQNRQTIGTQGLEDRRNIIEGASQDIRRATEITPITTEAEKTLIGARSEADIASIKQQGQNVIDQIKTSGAEERRNIPVRGAEDRKTLIQQGANEVTLAREQGRQERESLGTAGAEERATQADRLQLQREIETGVINIDDAIVGAMQFIRENGHEAVTAQYGMNPDTMKNMTDAEIAQSLAQVAPEDFEGKAVQSLTAFRTFADMDVNERRVAVEENYAEIAASAETFRQEMARVDQAFAQKATTAQITGLWEAYGSQELDMFKNAMNSTIGDDNYNSRYDFDSNGQIDFNDFLAFSEATQIGGIPTMQLQNLREGTRQFDLGQEQDAAQFTETLIENARQYDLSYEQTVKLGLLTLKTNIGVAEAQLDLQATENLIAFLGTYAAEGMTDEDFNDVFVRVLGEKGVLYDTLEIPEENKQKANNLNKVLSERDHPVEWFNEIEAAWPEMGQQQRDTLLSMGDFNGDGVVDIDDYIEYELAN